MANRRIHWLALVCLLTVMPASATLVYDNGAATLATIPTPAYFISGSTMGSGINWVSDTFTLLNNTALNSVQVAIWFPSTATVPASLNYCISLTADCSVSLEAGTNTPLTHATVIGSTAGYTLDDFSFALAGNTFSSGTYWLQLSNTSLTGGSAFWDVNHGTGCTGDNGSGGGCPSGGVASPGETAIASQGVAAGNNSESFQLFTTPEPGSLAMMGSGMLLLLAGVLRRGPR